ncbi:MAG: molybdopterin molybdotransferase MoeA [Desulfurococcales archaeon]|nr:molybdopterin molybdotransferase MoeA [Desulfurococcales archaeon]
MSEYNVIERLHSIKDARRLLERGLRRVAPGEETVGVDDALGRVSSRDVYSPMDVPPHDRSVLDGYAARWRDISTASEEAPAILRVKGRIEIDDPGSYEVGPGECYEVATGSPMPVGADVVVPIEHASAQGGLVYVYKPFPGGYGVSTRGEDLRRGERVLAKGDLVSEWHVGVLASIGVGRVSVWGRLRVGIVSTGQELIEPGVEYRPGKVYASTGRLAASYLRARGADARYLGILPDDEDTIRTFILENIGEYDVLMTTGGTSVGRKDAAIRALASVAEDLLHGLALTPGRPGAVGIVQGKPVMALSGMPVAAVSELIAVWDPVYRGLLGRERPWEPVLRARMARQYTSHPGMVNVVRTRTCIGSNGLVAEPLRVTGSGILSTLIKANSILIVPEDVTGIEEGEEVEVLLTGHLEVCKG